MNKHFCLIVFLFLFPGVIPFSNGKAAPFNENHLFLEVKECQQLPVTHHISYEAKLFLMSEGFKYADDAQTIEEINAYSSTPIEEYFKIKNFEGKYEQVIEIPLNVDGKLIDHIFVGLGKPNTYPDTACEYFRRSFSSVIPLMKKNKIIDLATCLPKFLEKWCNRSYADLIYEAGLAALLHYYDYDDYKSEKNRHNASITFCLSEEDFEYQREAEQSSIIATTVAHSMNAARNWMDGPANLVTPLFMAQQAEMIAKKHDNLTYRVLNEESATKLGMGAFMGVSQGSSNPGNIVILEYYCDDDAPTIGLCGKGITYDTGGVSLKPPSAMLGMKYDMCGGASVLAIMDLVAQFKPHCNVIGIAPFAENMPDGKSYREDDILTAMNGKTIEIINTDAEGRLALADALCYLEQEYRPDVIFTIATLTGACLHAVGHEYTAFMTQDTELLQLLQRYGNRTGDKMWPLPFHDDYMKANHSSVADVANAGSKKYQAGSIVAGKFLQNFIENARWAHLDIAGAAWGSTDINYVGQGATGASIRTLIHVIMDFSQYN